LTRGSGSKGVGEPCDASIDCAAPAEGFARCIHFRRTPTDGGPPTGGSFCQAALPVDATGQNCLVHGWNLVGPISMAQLLGAIEAGTANEVRECGLPGTGTQCFSNLVQEEGTCVRRLALGAPCSPHAPDNPACVEGAHCDDQSRVCVTDRADCESADTCQVPLDLWSFCNPAVDGGT
jgi:hypothetical protein